MIVYAVVCRASDAAILCEFSTNDLGGNVPQCTAALLEHLRDHPNVLKKGDLKTFRQQTGTKGGSAEDDFLSQFLQACTMAITTADEMDLGVIEEYFFHFWHEGDVFYCCLADDKDERHQKVNFSFLQALSRDFGARYSKRKIKNANSYAMDKDFKPVVRSNMHHYNIHRKDMIRQENVQIDHLMAQVEDLKTVLGRNLNLLLERDEQIDSLMQKANQARQDSVVFMKKSTKVKKTMRMKNFQMWFLICFSLFVLLYFLITSACGFRFQKCGAD
eukprot:jgi/Psemu1/225484/e_gw1.1619.3.1